MNAEKCKGNKHIGKYISQLYRKGSVFINKEVSEYGIGSGQFMFLLELYINDGKNQEEIAETLKIDKGTTARALKKLEEQGFVTRIKDENDKNSTGKMNLEEEDWEELLSEIDLVSFDFTTRLVDRYDALVDNDIRFCCLIKLGFKFSEIALILGCSVDAVYKKEKSILRRMDMEHTIRLKEILRNI